MPINISNLQKLFELAAEEAAQQQPPATSSPAPVAATGDSTPQATQPAKVNPQSQTSGQAISVEKIIDHLNGIRSGKSFNDPLIFTAITNIFNGLSSPEKAVLDKALSQLDKSIEQITKQQSPPNPNNQTAKGPSVQPQFGNQTITSPATPLQGPQQAQQMASNSPVVGMMGGLLSESSKDINSYNSANRAFSRSILKTNPKELISLLKPIATSKKKSLEEKIKEAFSLLAEKEIIGTYIPAVYTGRTSKKLNIDKKSIALLYINADKVLKLAGELQDVPTNTLKGTDLVIKVVFGPVETQNIFTEEKNMIETIVEKLSKNEEVGDIQYRPKDFAIIESNSLRSLHESVNRPNKTTVTINGEEVPFGSEQHKGQLVIVLQGLEDLKNCYRKGSSTRYTLAGACQKVRKILKDTAKVDASTVASVEDPNSEIAD